MKRISLAILFWLWMPTMAFCQTIQAHNLAELQAAADKFALSDCKMTVEVFGRIRLGGKTMTFAGPWTAVGNQGSITITAHDELSAIIADIGPPLNADGTVKWVPEPPIIHGLELLARNITAKGICITEYEGRGTALKISGNPQSVTLKGVRGARNSCVYRAPRPMPADQKPGSGDVWACPATIQGGGPNCKFIIEECGFSESGWNESSWHHEIYIGSNDTVVQRCRFVGCCQTLQLGYPSVNGTSVRIADNSFGDTVKAPYRGDKNDMRYAFLLDTNVNSNYWFRGNDVGGCYSTLLTGSVGPKATDLFNDNRYHCTFDIWAVCDQATWRKTQDIDSVFVP